MEQDPAPYYHFDSAHQEVVLELLGVPVDKQHETDIISDEPGYGRIMGRSLPVGIGFMEVFTSDGTWFTDN